MTGRGAQAVADPKYGVYLVVERSTTGPDSVDWVETPRTEAHVSACGRNLQTSAITLPR